MAINTVSELRSTLEAKKSRTPRQTELLNAVSDVRGNTKISTLESRLDATLSRTLKNVVK